MFFGLKMLLDLCIIILCSNGAIKCAQENFDLSYKPFIKKLKYPINAINIHNNLFFFTKIFGVGFNGHPNVVRNFIISILYLFVDPKTKWDEASKLSLTKCLFNLKSPHLKCDQIRFLFIYCL